MAVVPWEHIMVPNCPDDWAVKWTITGSDEGAPFIRPDLPDKTVILTGDFGAGSMEIQAGLDYDVPAYAVPKDSNGNPMTGIAAAYIESVQPNAVLLKPVATSVTSVVVVVVGFGARGRR